MKWLGSQDAFDRAYARAFSIRRRKANENATAIQGDFRTRMLHRLREAAAMEDAAKQTAREEDLMGYQFPGIYEHTRFGLRVRQAIGGPAKFYIEFVCGISAALAEYYFDPNAAKEIATRKKRVDAVIAESLSALRTLKLTLGDEFLGEAISALNYKGRPRTDFQLHQIDRQIELFSNLARAPAELAYPIARIDGTSRERLLVFRLYNLNRVQFRANKSEAIALLLQLEGIEAPMDGRTVERLCAKFREDSRQLFNQTRALSVTSQISGK